MEYQSLHARTALLGLFADPTRVRLLAVLEADALSVAELTRITKLPQSRVSTHLGKLRDAGLVRDRRRGSSTFYSMTLGEGHRALWSAIRAGLADDQVREDRERREQVLAARDRGETWVDAVAGQMERHYSPGRTWEATARGLLGLLRLGDALDIGSGDGAIAALLAPHARSITCFDRSEKALSAARERLSHHPNVRFAAGDMHALAFEDDTFDHVLLFNVLTYAREPRLAVREAVRVLRPGGDLVALTLREHSHLELSQAYDHVNAGFAPTRLRAMLDAAGLEVSTCEVTSRERKKPYFEVISAMGHKPAAEAAQ